MLISSTERSEINSKLQTKKVFKNDIALTVVKDISPEIKVPDKRSDVFEIRSLEIRFILKSEISLDTLEESITLHIREFILNQSKQLFQTIPTCLFF